MTSGGVTRIVLMAGFVAGLACVISAPVQAQSAAPPGAALDATRSLLGKMPEMQGAVIAEFAPIYAPRSRRVTFYEARLVDRELRPRGFAIVDTRGSIRQFDTEGASMRQRLAALTRVPFKMVRFGHNFYVAESDRGERLAQIGDFPRVLVDDWTGELMTTAGAVQATINGSTLEPPRFDESRVRRYSSQEAAYEDYARNYDKFFLQVPDVSTPETPGQIAMMMKADPDEPNALDSGGGPGPSSEVWKAIGFSAVKDHRVRQLEPNDPLNTSPGMWSGCGGAAFMNLFTWHDANWTPGLLSTLQGNYRNWESDDLGPPDPNVVFIVAHHLNRLRQDLGTFESFNDLGATLMWHMSEGIDDARFSLANKTDWWQVWGVPNIGGAKEAAQEMIRYYGKPVIVGYWSDVHYDLAHKSWNMGGEVYFKTTAGTWVTGGDMFYAGSAFDFASAGNWLSGLNHGFEHGLQRWSRKETSGGKVRGVRRSTTAFEGTAYARMESLGTTQKLWRFVEGSANALTQKVTAQVRATGGSGVLQARKVLGPESLEPIGSVIVSKSFSGTGGAWVPVEIVLPTSGGFILEVQFDATAGTTEVAHIDGFTLNGTFAKPPQPKGPCAPGKPGLDEGCDNP